MHPDKKREELEQIREFEASQQEGIFEAEKNEQNEEVSTDKVTVTETETVEALKKKKRDAMFELALFLILGFLIGVTVKTEAVKKITIGFNDYQITPVAQKYDVEALKKNLQQKMKEEEAAQESLPEQNLEQAQGPAVE